MQLNRGISNQSNIMTLEKQFEQRKRRKRQLFESIKGMERDNSFSMNINKRDGFNSTNSKESYNINNSREQYNTNSRDQYNINNKEPYSSYTNNTVLPIRNRPISPIRNDTMYFSPIKNMLDSMESKKYHQQNKSAINLRNYSINGKLNTKQQDQLSYKKGYKQYQTIGNPQNYSSNQRKQDLLVAIRKKYSGNYKQQQNQINNNNSLRNRKDNNNSFGNRKDNNSFGNRKDNNSSLKNRKDSFRNNNNNSSLINKKDSLIDKIGNNYPTVITGDYSQTEPSFNTGRINNSYNQNNNNNQNNNSQMTLFRKTNQRNNKDCQIVSFRERDCNSNYHNGEGQEWKTRNSIKGHIRMEDKHQYNCMSDLNRSIINVDRINQRKNKSHSAMASLIIRGQTTQNRSIGSIKKNHHNQRDNHTNNINSTINSNNNSNNNIQPAKIQLLNQYNPNNYNNYRKFTYLESR